MILDKHQKDICHHQCCLLLSIKIVYFQKLQIHFVVVSRREEDITWYFCNCHLHLRVQAWQIKRNININTCLGLIPDFLLDIGVLRCSNARGLNFDIRFLTPLQLSKIIYSADNQLLKEMVLYFLTFFNIIWKMIKLYYLIAH